MTPRQWSKIKQIFAEAAQLDPPQREAYLKLTCRHQDLRREVESLLAQHDKAEHFMGVYSSVGGRVLSHYEVHDRIGEGGMAIVYRARDTRLKRWVALKVLQPWAMGHQDSRERLINEARWASALNHPNIVTIHEVAQENDVWFIVMEYASGKTLGQAIPSTGLPVPEALHYATQIADALAAAHSAGIVHGDLKPLNIIVSDAGQAKLLDFGLAKALDSRPGESSEPAPRFGTKVYMAPELLKDRHLDPDPLAEIFSFGLVLFEMLAGGHAFGKGTPDERVRAIQSKRPRALPDKVPASLARIVYRCLEKSSERRHPSMREVLIALTKCHPGQGGGWKPTALRPVPLMATHDTEGERAVADAIARVGYENIAESRQALAELEHVLEGGPSLAARTTVTSGLKTLILTVNDFQGNVIPPPVRQVRKAVLEILKLATQGALSRCFKNRDFETLDLYDMNFAFERLAGFSFRDCFLVEASFQDSELSRASFAGAYIRNVNFAGAHLSGADFTDADWFNAMGLTERQLRAVQKRTLEECPPTVEAMRYYLDTHYALPFEAWSARVQEQLRAAWKEYLRPNGLRDVVATWRRKSP